MGQADAEAFEERAAIVAESAGVPVEWAEGLARLDTMPTPDGFTADRWQQVVDDAGRFLDRWGRSAAAAGWTTAEIFGVSPVAPEPRLDLAGVVVLLAGRRVVALTDGAIWVANPGGRPLVIGRGRPADPQVPLWNLPFSAE